MKQTLTNNLLTIEASGHGAELQSIKSRLSGHEYLWQGDAAFWGRRSPVLFPIVGSVWGGEFKMDGQVWPMSQHGFARDMDFEAIERGEPDEMWFALESDDETLTRYPRRFRLEIGYRLQEARITVMWRVVNCDSRPMAFQIGAHPAFNYPDFDSSAAVHGYFAIGSRGVLTSEVIAEKGCVGTEERQVEVDAHGMLPLTMDVFNRDALIFAGGRVHRVSMLDSNRNPYLTLLFDAPVVGLWSPSGEAPFVCVEPWWGRADSVGFDGDFADRKYANVLAPGATFEASYTIIIDNL